MNAAVGLYFGGRASVFIPNPMSIELMYKIVELTAVPNSLE